MIVFSLKKTWPITKLLYFFQFFSCYPYRSCPRHFMEHPNQSQFLILWRSALFLVILLQIVPCSTKLTCASDPGVPPELNCTDGCMINNFPTSVSGFKQTGCSVISERAFRCTLKKLNFEQTSSCFSVDSKNAQKKIRPAMQGCATDYPSANPRNSLIQDVVTNTFWFCYCNLEDMCNMGLKPTGETARDATASDSSGAEKRSKVDEKDLFGLVVITILFINGIFA